MVGTTIFSWIDMRLKYLFDSSLPFGGKSVTALGDFNQLPPVASKPLYSSKVDKDPYVAVFGTMLWQELFKVHRLDQIMRQRDDLSFAIALNNMAIGEMTTSDVDLMQSRVVQMTEEEMKLLENKNVIFPHLRATGGDEAVEDDRPICLFHSNEEVRNMNAAILQRMTTEGAISVGFDRVIGPNTSNESAVKYVLNQVSNDSIHQLTNLSMLKNTTAHG